jgi:hypothetical protein
MEHVLEPILVVILPVPIKKKQKQLIVRSN